MRAYIVEMHCQHNRVKLGGVGKVSDTIASLRQIRGTHKVLVDPAGCLAAFGDGPDHEGLAAAHVAGAEDSRDASHVVLVGKHVASWIELQTQLLDHTALLRAQETKR